MTFYYQKSEHDCWICALRNFLSFLDIHISEDEILDLIQHKNKLPVFCKRGFFTYLPVVLDELDITCDVILDSKNILLQNILDQEQGLWKICPDRLDQIIQDYERQEDAICYLYKALKLVAFSSNITLKFDSPSVKTYIDQDYVVVACLTVSELYGIADHNAFHCVTLIKKQGKTMMIDPYETLGKEEANWMVWRKKSHQYDWARPIPYFVAAKVKKLGKIVVS